MKIYSDDPNLPYKTTKLKALYTKSEIEGLFAKWGVKDARALGSGLAFLMRSSYLFYRFLLWQGKTVRI